MLVFTNALYVKVVIICVSNHQKVAGYELLVRSEREYC